VAYIASNIMSRFERLWTLPTNWEMDLQLPNQRLPLYIVSCLNHRPSVANNPNYVATTEHNHNIYGCSIIEPQGSTNITNIFQAICHHLCFNYLHDTLHLILGCYAELCAFSITMSTKCSVGRLATLMNKSTGR